ncbi:hypothetical protein [Halomicronema sp. CCY15110]|uniref:hypothetical protein n=1 Tax=Halomicronema sp. CCY15110 TaxID=2767773 RepID=UPI00195184DF|nr:hypothetical protein [Halomicronema sp. CCY15110]
MRYLTRRYHIQVIQPQNREPAVQGWEEVNWNGQRHVRYFNADESWPNAEWFEDFWGCSQPLPDFDWGNEWGNAAGIDAHSPCSAPRRIQVITDNDDSAGAARQGWQRSRQVLQQATHKVAQVARNIPAAWQAAGRELNR